MTSKALFFFILSLSVSFNLFSQDIVRCSLNVKADSESLSRVVLADQVIGADLVQEGVYRVYGKNSVSSRDRVSDGEVTIRLHEGIIVEDGKISFVLHARGQHYFEDFTAPTSISFKELTSKNFGVAIGRVDSKYYGAVGYTLKCSIEKMRPLCEKLIDSKNDEGGNPYSSAFVK